MKKHPSRTVRIRQAQNAHKGAAIAGVRALIAEGRKIHHRRQIKRSADRVMAAVAVLVIAFVLWRLWVGA